MAAAASETAGATGVASGGGAAEGKRWGLEGLSAAEVAARVPKVTLCDGTEIPAIGLGTFRAEPGLVGAAVKDAIRMGYRHIDCAAIYHNEVEIGEALKELFDAGEVKREELYIVSKLWNTDHDVENVRKACEKTIADLQCGYLNLYLIHFPLAFEHTGIGRTGFALDEEGVVKMAPVSLESTYRAMEALVDAGLVKSIGVSNYPFILYADCLAYARIKPVTNQIEAHPYFANDWFVKYCTKRGTLITAHTPLGGAAANASWRGGTDSPLVDPVITEIAARHHKSPAQVCLRWGLQRGTIIIPKSSKAERLRENLDVLDFELTEEEMAAINKVDREERSNKSGRAWGIQFSA